MELGRDSWGGGFGSSYGGARGGGPMRGDYGSRDSGPYGGQLFLRLISNCLFRVINPLNNNSSSNNRIYITPLRGGFRDAEVQRW